MTQKSLPLAAVFFAFASVVHADETTVPDAMHAPAQGVDWSGVYAGLSYGTARSTLNLPAYGEFDYYDGRAKGAFLGYNLQRGNLVYGGEISYATVSGMVLSDPSLLSDDTLDTLMGLRGRVGYALGNALIYGSIGLSRGSMTFNGVDTPNVSGNSVALGMDYKFSEKVFVGLDYTRMKLDGTNDNPGHAFAIEAPVSAVSLRVGLSF